VAESVVVGSFRMRLFRFVLLIEFQFPEIGDSGCMRSLESSVLREFPKAT